MNTPFLNRSTSPNEIRKIFQWIRTKITEALGTMAYQNHDNVNIDGGSIEGTDIDVSGATLTLADNQVDADKIGTTETDTSKVLKPDGAGGVQFGAVNTEITDLTTTETDTDLVLKPDGLGGVEWGASSGVMDIITAKKTMRVWDGTAEVNEDFDVPLTDGNGNILIA